jgi:YfiH family protein
MSDIEQVSAARRGEDWTPWAGIKEDPIGLARYVSDRVPDVFLTERLRRDGDSPSIARRAYDQLAKANLNYLLPYWTPRGSQWVRDPQWFSEESGTCIDAAATFASMLRYAHLHPAIVVLEGRGWSHALVGVLGRTSLDPPTSAWTPYRTVEVDEFDTTFDCVVDVIGAMAGAHRSSWEDAIGARVDRWIKRFGGRGTIHVVDIVAAHLEVGEAEWRTTSDRPRPSVSLRLSGPPSGARDRVGGLKPGHAVEAAKPVVVLHGPQGVGKSVLARQLAAMPHRSHFGWVLNASDGQSLARSLAAAALREAGRPPELLTSAGEIDESAREAVARLSRELPWTVVLDNADCDPESLRRWLPDVRAEHGQSLIVTTASLDHRAKQSWHEWATSVSAGWIEVQPLASDQVRRWFPAAEPFTELTGGRVLFAAAFDQAVVRGARPAIDLQDVPADLDPAALRLWEAVRDKLDPDLRATARRIAWLQPDEIPNNVVPDDERLCLQEFGLISRQESTFSIHRLIAAAVRTNGGALDALSDARSAADLHARAMPPELARLRAAVREATAGADAWAEAVEHLIEVHEARGLAAELETEDLCRCVVDRLSSVDSNTDSVPQRRAKATAHHGIARVRNQRSNKERDRVPEGIEAALTAIQLRQSFSDTDPWAVEGLCLASQAVRWLLEAARPVSEIDARRTIERAIQELELVTERRVARDKESGTVHHDTARSYVNTAGRRVRLAQLDEPRAAAHLDDAWHDYERALAIRRELFRVVPGAFEAATFFGYALVDYYRAILHPLDGPAGVVLAGDRKRRTDFLQRAAANNQRGGEIRDRASVNGDTGDSLKHVDLAVKIALARRIVTPSPEEDASQGMTFRVAQRREARDRDVERAAAEFDLRSVAAPIDCGRATWLRAVVTTVHGGVSNDSYSCLNLGDHVGDDRGAVRENRRRVCESLGLDMLTVSNQTHGNGVALIDQALAGAGYTSDEDARLKLPNTDAMITGLSKVALSILVADCIPILIYDPEVRALGVAHAGRGGIVTDVIGETVAALSSSFGAVPGRMHAHLGPHIGLESYEVGQAELDEYRSMFPRAPVLARPVSCESRGGAGCIDLGYAARRRLQGAGVPVENITRSAVDTYGSAHHFSHRRQTHVTDAPNMCGRFAMIAWIA